MMKEILAYKTYYEKLSFSIYYIFFNLKLFKVTVTLLMVILNAANIGFMVMPNGINIPAAIGIIQML